MELQLLKNIMQNFLNNVFQIPMALPLSPLVRSSVFVLIPILGGLPYTFDVALFAAPYLH